MSKNIITAIGESRFKSEACIAAFLEDDSYIYDRSKQLYQVQKVTSGGYICGEIKLAITLCMLTGGKSLDLAAIFVISESGCKEFFLM